MVREMGISKFAYRCVNGEDDCVQWNLVLFLFFRGHEISKPYLEHKEKKRNDMEQN